MTKPMRLVRDKHESNTYCDDQTEALGLAGEELLLLMEDFRTKASSMDSAMVLLADLQEVLNLIDGLTGRRLSKVRLERYRDFGGYNETKIAPVTK